MTAKEYKEQPHVRPDNKIFMVDGYQQLSGTYCLQVLKININPRRRRNWKSGEGSTNLLHQMNCLLYTSVTYLSDIHVSMPTFCHIQCLNILHSFT